MDPITAQRLFDEGKITQATLDAILNKPSGGFDAPDAGMFDRQLDTSPIPVPSDTLASPSVAALPDITAQSAPEPALAPPPVAAPLQAPVTQQVVSGETQTITSKQKNATDKAVKAELDLEKSFEASHDAATQKAEIDKQASIEKFNLGKQEQQIIEEAATAEQDIREEGQIEIEDRLAELDIMTAELGEREYKGYWANKSTGDKILGAISLALGAYSSATTGGPNTALTIINGAMDKDFARYKDATANKIKAISNSRLDLKTKSSLIKSQLDGLQSKKEADILQVQKKISNLSNKFAKPEHKAKLAELGAQLDQKKAESRLDFEKGLEEETATSITRKIEAVQIDPTTGKAVKPDQASKEEIKLAESYRRHPTIQAFDKISAQFNKIKSAQDTAAGDLSLIFSYMKILDPGSVVREGEFATAQNAAGVPDRVRNLLNNAMTGERLTEAQRKEFTEQAGKLLGAQKEDNERIRKQFVEEATRLGLSPDRIVPPAPIEQKTIIQQLYSPSRNQTKIIYSDGTEEIRDGR